MTYPSETLNFPSELLTGDSLNVFSERPSYEDGRQFRIDYEFSVDSGDTQVIKFEIGSNINLLLSNIDVDQGGLYYRVFSGGTEGGTFSDAVTVYPANSKSGVATPTPAVTVSTGGTLDITGEEPNTTLRIRTANSNAQRNTVGGVLGDMRGFPSTTAYVVITTLTGVNTTCTGTIKLRWEQE